MYCGLFIKYLDIWGPLPNCLVWFAVIVGVYLFSLNDYLWREMTSVALNKCIAPSMFVEAQSPIF